MPYIKKLVIHGFKSFARKTELQFSKGINVILGPNGSGKCVTGDTLVTLSDGTKKRIDELVNSRLDKAIRTEDGFLIPGDGLKIMSFVDRRFSDGHGYSAVGFDLIRSTPPNYFYLNQDDYSLIPRYRAQKHKLPAILGDKFNPSKTEKMNMIDNGYRIYYDCGNFVFEL